MLEPCGRDMKPEGGGDRLVRGGTGEIGMMRPSKVLHAG